jgi:hypothetical protein
MSPRTRTGLRMIAALWWKAVAGLAVLAALALGIIFVAVLIEGPAPAKATAVAVVLFFAGGAVAFWRDFYDEDR